MSPSFRATWIYVGQLWHPLLDLPQLLVTGKQTFVCIDRLEELRCFEPEFVDGRGGERPVPSIDRLELADVSFRFDEEKPACALSRVSLDLPRGRKLAVVGPIGAGKSTLARLVAGELRPTTGRVRVNGVDLADLDVTEYRKRVGYIPQEALLFSDTVRENVVFGREVADDALGTALAIAQVDEEVAAFPNGLEELLGQRGVRLSGGQRQRLAVARAVVGGPDLLVMDDVTAALDAENEEALWDALAQRHPGLTAIIVTHRAATARCALYRKMGQDDA